MVKTKNPKIVICSKCGSQNLVYDDNTFMLCTQCKCIKRIKNSEIEY